MPRKLTITKYFKFNSAHYLPEHPGRCANLHGHEWKLEVTVRRTTTNLDSGMVIDFSRLKQIVNESVVDRLDHRLLNDILPTPTAENIIQRIANELEGAVSAYNLELVKLRLWETDTSCATLEID